jgi:hypothetical protein
MFGPAISLEPETAAATISDFCDHNGMRHDNGRNSINTQPMFKASADWILYSGKM